MAACATPGTGRPSLTTDDASPTTNTSGTPGTSRCGPTDTPTRAIRLATEQLHDRRGGDARGPQHRGAGHSPAVATTPFSSTASTLTPVRTSTPSFSSRRVALFCKALGKRRKDPLAALDQDDRAAAGSIRRNCERSVVVANCAIEAASSTPVGPPPTRTNVISRAR